ncbi:MAG: 1-acyl-sn-glycerol-3-phosphate acyltransferase [Lachnospiraceae bacterium]|nr:1-acyl-sn-glycerol-3-phosphate acyltransferase [Lachnospiraceae bacterium]
MTNLSALQKRLSETGISNEEYLLREKEFQDAYYACRSRAENGLFGRMSLKTRKRLHFIILSIFTIKNHLSGFTHRILCDGRQMVDRPLIFAVTHVGKYDIEVVSEAIRDHYYLLMGDYEHIQGKVEEPFLNLNGVIYFNEKVKEERQAVPGRMVDVLRNGGNLMYFPEGAWNLSPNLPVLPCYWGIIDVAREGNAVIVPIAADQYGKHFDIAIGENMDMNLYGDGKDEKSRAITDLRDTLASLKWEIWRQHSAKRSEIVEDEWENYCNDRCREWSEDFSREFLDEYIYKPKGVTTPAEAFAFMRSLKPCRENAFLFRKM